MSSWAVWSVTNTLAGGKKSFSFSIFKKYREIRTFMGDKEFHDTRELSDHYFCDMLFNKHILVPSHNTSSFPFCPNKGISLTCQMSLLEWRSKELYPDPPVMLSLFSWLYSRRRDYILTEWKKMIKLAAAWTCIMWNKESIIMERKIPL